MAGFEVFLDLQAEHVGVDGKVDLVGQLFHFPLLRLDLAPLLGNSGLELKFVLFARLHFLAKAFLVRGSLDPDLLVVRSGVLVHHLDLVTFLEDELFFSCNMVSGSLLTDGIFKKSFDLDEGLLQFLASCF